MSPKRKTPPGYVTIQLTRRIRVSTLLAKITRTENMIKENQNKIRTFEAINVNLTADLTELRALMAKVKEAPESVSQEAKS